MRVIGFVSVLTLLIGCGRTAKDSGAISPDGSGGAGTSTPGLGPIDATEQPATLDMQCDQRGRALAFKLPCLVGMNLNGNPDEPGLHIVECELANEPGQIAVTFTLPLKNLPLLMEQPLSLPFDGVVTPPPAPGVDLDAERFVGTLSGVITFSQVDVDGRAFVAALEQGRVAWSGSKGSSFDCSTIDGPIWGIAGSFL